MQEMWVPSLHLGRSPGKWNGNPLQYSCLENPIDRGAWQTTVHGVAQSLTWLSKQLSMHMTVWRYVKSLCNHCVKSLKWRQWHISITLILGIRLKWSTDRRNVSFLGYFKFTVIFSASLVAQRVKHLLAMQETQVQFLCHVLVIFV